MTPRRWLTDLALGARMAGSGGRSGRARTALTALGVGLGAALLLLAASVPAALAARDDRVERIEVQWGQDVAQPAADTLLVRHYDLEFRDQGVRGLLVQPEGAKPPLPPGVAQLPGPGELVVSPALARLLESADGELLRPRLDYPVAGTIGDRGLSAPDQLAFYLGDDTLTETGASRIDHFGVEGAGRDSLPPELLALLAVGVVVLLLPVAMFVAVAVRFGGEQRDRRLAAVRLAGADVGAIRRIAAGEALLAAAVGLLAGAVFFLVGRQLVERIVVFDVSVFAADLRPSAPLLAVVLVGVPAMAVGVTMLAMRGLVVEPLGVVRRGRAPRRRLWWRFLPAIAGLLVLFPLMRRDLGAGNDPYLLAGGVGLLLLGVTALLPWLIDAMVRRQRGGGPVSWQLAMRRLQLSGGSVGRIVNGTALAAAGAIALQMVFTSVEADTVSADEAFSPPPGSAMVLPGNSTGREIDGALAESVGDRFAAASGVRAARSFQSAMAHATKPHEAQVRLVIADCSTLQQLAKLPKCAGDEVFLVDPAGAETAGGMAPEVVERGVELRFDTADGARRWQVPPGADVVTVTDDLFRYSMPPAVLATPAAAVPAPAPHLRVHLQLDPAVPDAIEHVRNAAASLDRSMNVTEVGPPISEAEREFNTIRSGLLAGVAATLVLIGLSLLVSTMEQLRERRRLLAMLAAVGAGRRQLAWSVLWQTAVPVVLGLLLAVSAGIGVGALLTVLVTSRSVAVDVANVAAVAGIAAGVVLLVTLATMPALWRLMRPEGLRTE